MEYDAARSGRGRPVAPAAGLAAVEPAAGDDHARGQPQDAQVERRGLLLDVPEVELDALGPRQRRAALDLRPAGDAGADGQAPALALGVAVDLHLDGRPR